MTVAANIARTTAELDNFLDENDYFSTEDPPIANQKILAAWGAKLESAIIADILSKFDHLDIAVSAAQFELSSEDNQGACLYFCQIAICDKANSEVLKAFVKTLINYNKTTIYLESSYADVDRWQGKSKALRLIFDKLKSADKKVGYF